MNGSGSIGVCVFLGWGVFFGIQGHKGKICHMMRSTSRLCRLTTDKNINT